MAVKKAVKPKSRSAAAKKGWATRRKGTKKTTKKRAAPKKRNMRVKPVTFSRCAAPANGTVQCSNGVCRLVRS